MQDILSIEDIKFLKELGHKRKTQETDGCADSVFWMIQDERIEFTDDGEYKTFFDDNGNLYNTYDEFDKNKLEGFKNYIKENFRLDEDEFEELKEVSDNDALEDFIYLYDIDINYRRFTMQTFISSSTGSFLTKEAAKEHLKDNHYHYSKNARISGIVGWRNPEFKKLMQIVEKFDDLEVGVDSEN